MISAAGAFFERQIKRRYRAQHEANVLEEMVVTANAIRRDKRSLGYSAPVIRDDELRAGRRESATAALQGKVAGVNVTSTSSSPGSSSRIVLRGGSSILGNNQALMVVDWVPIDNSDLLEEVIYVPHRDQEMLILAVQ